MGAEHIWEGKVARCADCIYCDNSPRTDDLVVCRHKPPEAAYGHPLTSKDNWCGYFQPVDENQTSTDY